MLNTKPISLAGGEKYGGSSVGLSNSAAVIDVAAIDGDKAQATDSKLVDAALVVFGRDDKQKAHASRFDEDNREAALKAAHLMGFVALAVTHDAIKAIAADLPDGRVFDSGKAFVPFVKEGTCLTLEAHAKQFPLDVQLLSKDQIEALEAEMAKNAESDEVVTGADGDGDDDDETDSDDVSASVSGNADDETAGSEPNASDDWISVDVGTIVVAVDHPDDGWWEAKVTHVNKSGIGTKTVTMLTLEWLSFPDEPSFLRRVNEVAHLHSTHGQGPSSSAYTKEDEA